MFGLLLAGVYAAYQMIFNNVPFEVVYLAATHFLVWWYALWTIPTAILLVLLSLGITVGSGLAGAGVGKSAGGILGGGLAGAAMGGGVSLLLCFVFILKAAARISGAYLLSTALILQTGGGYTWDKGRLIVGGILLVITLLMRSRISNTSSSSSSKKS